MYETHAPDESKGPGASVDMYNKARSCRTSCSQNLFAIPSLSYHVQYTRGSFSLTTQEKELKPVGSVVTCDALVYLAAVAEISGHPTSSWLV